MSGKMKRLAVLLAVALLVLPAMAGALSFDDHRGPGPGLFEWLWNALVETVTSTVAPGRGAMDPNGDPVLTDADLSSEGDGRGSMDPNG